MERAAEFSPGRLLALYPALASLAPEEIAAICKPEVTAVIAEGTELFAERHACRGFPLLIEGSIKVVKNTSAGREMLLYRVEPGGSCVITSSCLLGHTHYTARGIAETPLRLLMLPTALFEKLIAGNAAFRDFVFHLLAQRIAELMQLVEDVAFHRLDQRLAKLLLGKGERARALELLGKASAALPDDASIAFHYASAQAAAGDRGAARGTLRPLLQRSFPEQNEAWALFQSLAP